MKKSIMTLCVAAAAIFGFGAAAQCPASPADCPRGACPTPCETPAQCGNQACRPDAACPAFEGLNLTDAQKQQLAEIRKQCRSGQQCDSAATRCDRSRRVDNLHKVKAVLTPEQYVTFLENIAATSPAGPRHRMHADRRHHGERGRMVRADRKVRCTDASKAKAGACPQAAKCDK